MKQSLTGPAIAAIVTFILNFIIQLFFDNNKVDIYISDTMPNSDSTYLQTINITNFYDSPKEDLNFKLLNGIIEDVKTTSNIEFKILNGNLISLNKVYAKTNSVILVRYKLNSINNPKLITLNEGERGIDILNETVFTNFDETIIFSLLVNALIIFLAALIFQYITENTKTYIKKMLDEEKIHSERLNKKIDEFKEENEKTEIKLANTRDRISRIETISARLKIILTKRVSDLKIENDFYRHCIKLALSSVTIKDETFNIEEFITSSLKTYSTRARLLDDNKSIDVLTELISDPKWKKKRNK